MSATSPVQFGEWLRRQREARGWSLRDLASRTGLSHAYLRLIERGYDPRSGAPVRPTVESLVSLANGLGIAPETLFSVYLDSQVYSSLSHSTVNPHQNITIPVYEAVIAHDPELRHTEPIKHITLQLGEEARGVYFAMLAPDDSMAYCLSRSVK